MMQFQIDNVETTRKFAIVVYGDTNGFSSFARRTSEQPEIHRGFLLELYNLALGYQKETDCFLKLLLDGFMFVHEFEGRPSPEAVHSILVRLSKIYDDIDSAIGRVVYPRPEGFRIRVSMGVVWSLVIGTKGGCAVSSIRDYFEYPTILAHRMLEISKETPLMCCQAVKELLDGFNGQFEFKKVPAERRVPSGVFKEDMAGLLEFRRKKK